MTDHRTKRQKLEAMARQTVSPHEAEVARLKLAAMGPPLKAPEYRAKAHEFRFSNHPGPASRPSSDRFANWAGSPTTEGSPFTAEDLAFLRDELRRRSFDDLFDLFQRSTSSGFYSRPVPTLPCERCLHPHKISVCTSCGPLGPCGSTCMRCRHSQHRGGVCYWCTPLSSELSSERRSTGPCAPGYDPNWDAYVSGTECPRCHAGHHSPIYCTGTETQP